MNEKKKKRCILNGEWMLMTWNSVAFPFFPSRKYSTTTLLATDLLSVNSDDEQARLLVPETTQKSVPTNQALPTAPFLSDSSERIRFSHASRRNRIREASRGASFQEKTWEF